MAKIEQAFHSDKIMVDGTKEIRNKFVSLIKEKELSEEDLIFIMKTARLIPNLQKEVNAKTFIEILTTENDQPILTVGEERIMLSEYEIQSSADGTTELCVKIKGDHRITALSANSKKWMPQD